MRRKDVPRLICAAGRRANRHELGGGFGVNKEWFSTKHYGANELDRLASCGCGFLILNEPNPLACNKNKFIVKSIDISRNI